MPVIALVTMLAVFYGQLNLGTIGTIGPSKGSGGGGRSVIVKQGE